MTEEQILWLKQNLSLKLLDASDYYSPYMSTVEIQLVVEDEAVCSVWIDTGKK